MFTCVFHSNSVVKGHSLKTRPLWSCETHPGLGCHAVFIRTQQTPTHSVTLGSPFSYSENEKSKRDSYFKIKRPLPDNCESKLGILGERTSEAHLCMAKKSQLMIHLCFCTELCD